MAREVIAGLAGGLVGAGLARLTAPQPRELDPGLEVSYVVYTDGSKYYAKNGNTEKIEFTDTNISTLLQNVINTLYERHGGGRIFIKRGTYYVKGLVEHVESWGVWYDAIMIPNGIKLIIEGEGGNTVFKWNDKTNFIQHRPDSPTWSSIVILRNFKIDRSTRAPGSASSIIRVNYAKIFIVDGVEYEGVLEGSLPNAVGDTVIEGYNNIYAEVRNCRLRGAGYGTWVFAFNTHIHDNYGELLAQEGFSGAGLLPNFMLPPGFEAGGLTVIENNACVDCGINEAVYAVDYGADSPLIPNSMGIIKNNIAKTINHTTIGVVGGVNVGALIVENNRIIGNIGVAISTSSCDKVIVRKNFIDIVGKPVATYNQAYIFTWGQLGRKITYVEFSDNYVNVVLDPAVNYPVFLHFSKTDTVVIRRNVITVTYQFNGGVGNMFLRGDIGVSRLVFEDNIVNVSTVQQLGQVINMLEGDPTLYAVIRRNRVTTSLSDYPGALAGIIFINRYTGADVPLLVVEDNYVFNAVGGGHIVQLQFRQNANLLYLVLKGNTVRGPMSEKANILAIDSGLAPRIVVDSDLPDPLASIPSGVTVNFKRRRSGVATIPAGSTRITVPHELISTPSRVLITPLAQPPGKLWIENITATSFDIVTDTAPATDLPVAWYAEG